MTYPRSHLVSDEEPGFYHVEYLAVLVLLRSLC